MTCICTFYYTAKVSTDESLIFNKAFTWKFSSLFLFMARDFYFIKNIQFILFCAYMHACRVEYDFTAGFFYFEYNLTIVKRFFYLVKE